MKNKASILIVILMAVFAIGYNYSLAIEIEPNELQQLMNENNLGASVLRVTQGGTGVQTLVAGECVVANGTNPFTSAPCGAGGGIGTDAFVATAPLTLATTSDIATFGITLASSTVDGYLSSTDWTTFNNKYDFASTTLDYWFDNTSGITPSTQITAGTNLSWSTNTLNVDDSFLLNTGDTATGDYTITGDLITSNIQYAIGTSTDTLYINQICNQAGECFDSPNTSGSAISFYPNNDSADIATYENIYVTPTAGVDIDESCNADDDIDGGYCLIDSYISSTSDITILNYPAGTTKIEAYSYVNSNAGVSSLVFKGYVRTAGGTETLLGTATTTEINGDTGTLYTSNFTGLADYPFNTDGTDRLVLKVYGHTTSGVAKTIHWLYQSSGTYSHFVTPITIADEGYARIYADEIITGAWLFDEVISGATDGNLVTADINTYLKLNTIVADQTLAYGGGAFHDGFSDFVANEHTDWRLTTQGTIHATNYVDNNNTYLGGTGLTLATDTFNVDTSQSITVLSNLTTNGFVKTSGGNGTLSVDTSTYLTGNETITLSGDVSGSGATAITTTIGADKILESMLKSVNAPTDEYALTYESTTGDFEWQATSGGVSTADVYGIVDATTTLPNLILTGQTFTRCYSFASSTAIASGTVRSLGSFGTDVTIVSHNAKVKDGTTLGVRISDGTNFMNAIVASTTRNNIAVSTNNTWTAYEDIEFQAQVNTGTVTNGDYCINYKQN